MKTIATVIVMSLLLLYVWERVDLVRLGYRIQQLKVSERALQREYDALRVKVSAMSSPERIARLATERLGMVRPEPGQVILVTLGPVAPGVDQPSMEAVRLAKHEPR